MRHKQVVPLVVSMLAACLLTGSSCSRKRDAGHASRRTAVLMPLDDSAQDGMPDFMRLDSEQDRAAFRRWFTFLAEAQYFNAVKNRPAEIVDCASLLRYCYREALRAHDSVWASDAHLPLVPAFASVKKYNYPYTPLSASLFRIRIGAFTRANLNDGSFAQFADAEMLERFNMYRVSRDLRRAQQGDLLFFRRRIGENAPSFHSMIFLGHSEIQPSATQYVVYDTGRDGAKTGQIRLLRVEDLLRFPDPEWRPVAANPQFLGVFRWNILRDSL